jgi:hypothetical protein
MKNPRFLTLAGMIVLAAVSRLIPHPWNFSPVAAMALFAGAHFSKKSEAFLVTFGALILSDVILGFYGVEMVFVYLSYIINLFIGFAIKGRRRVGPVALAAMAGSVQFFIVTNFGSWVGQRMYPPTLAGLVQCYTLAIPFFRGTLFGDLFYTALLFGSFALAERNVPALREQTATA